MFGLEDVATMFSDAEEMFGLFLLLFLLSMALVRLQKMGQCRKTEIFAWCYIVRVCSRSIVCALKNQ